MKRKKATDDATTNLPDTESCPQLSLADEIAFQIILNAGPIKTKKDNESAVATYPRILEDL